MDRPSVYQPTLGLVWGFFYIDGFEWWLNGCACNKIDSATVINYNTRAAVEYGYV